MATTPYTVAVGGTQFNEGSSSAFWGTTNTTGMSSAVSYIPEDVWNANCAGTFCNATGLVLATGGGRSSYFAKPSWQKGVTGIPNDGKRDVPDVSLTAAAHDSYLLCLEGSCTANNGVISFTTVYGTSAAAPSFAGIMALVNQKTGKRQGNANAVLYSLAATENWSGCNASNTSTLPPTSCIFHDVTVGTNAVPGEKGYDTSSETYPATVGYDLATGLGSVNAAALVNAWTNGSSGSTPFPTPPFSVSPASGSGATQAFTFTFSNAAGAAQIAQSQMLITGNGASNQACSLIYKASTNGLYLTADNGTTLTGPITPGSSASLSNSQCSVTGSSVSVSPLGNSLFVTETLNFKSSFAGSKTIGMSTIDTANKSSGWSTVGTWAVPGTPVVTTPTPSVSPSSGSGATQAFTFTFSNAKGAANIGQAHMLITGNNTGNQACYLIYQASNNGLYLTSDNGSSLIGPATPGGSSSLSNSQCSVAASSVSVTPSGNTLKITETSSFKAAFAGSKTIMMYTFDTSNVGSGWSNVGTWTVPGTSATPPFAVSPASGSGATQAFVFTFTSSAGASSIWQGHMLITGNGTGNQACYLIYQSSNNSLYLTSDNGSSQLGPVTPGGSGTLSNSQCSVAASSVSVSSSGNTLKITETTSFKHAFNGSKNTMMYMFNNANVGTGWATVGSWTVNVP
jgi:hypothetical protein